MHKLIATFTVLYLVCLVGSMIMEGSGGLNSTRLNGALNSTDVAINVDNTSGFLTADYLVIGDEKVSYTGKTATQFTGCVRGYDNTTASTHADNYKVYAPEASFFNYLLGFNIVTVAQSWGGLGALSIPVRILTTSLPRLAFFNWSWAEGGGVWLQYFFQAVGSAMLLSIALVVFGSGI